MTFAGVAAVRSLLAARLDMSVPWLSIRWIIRRKLALRYCKANYQIDARVAWRSQKSEPDCPGSPATYPVGDRIGTQVVLRCRHQHGVDHMDHAGRLIDVRH